jgi:hypothetical protein
MLLHWVKPYFATYNFKIGFAMDLKKNCEYEDFQYDLTASICEAHRKQKKCHPRKENHLILDFIRYSYTLLAVLRM